MKSFKQRRLNLREKLSHMTLVWPRNSILRALVSVYGAGLRREPNEIGSLFFYLQARQPQAVRYD
jgi:hypothetical protein